MSTSGNDTLMRQWAMLRLIPRSPRKVSAQDLRKNLAIQGFSTSSRTIERDLQNLSARFGLVVDESSRPYGWSWAKDANFEFTPRLSTSQSVALLLSQVHLRNFLPQSLLNDLAPLFAMAQKEVGPTGWRDWHQRTAILPTSFQLLPPRIAARVLDDTHHALALGRCLTGRYQAKGNNTAKELLIHPLGIIVRGSVQYLVCTLRSYTDVRHLALHRLSRTQVIDTPCVPPSGFDFRRYVSSQADKFEANGQVSLVARFRADAAEHLRETAVSLDQSIVELDGGEWVELTATVVDDRTLRWWLLGFGANVEVISPQSIRCELGEHMRVSAGRYARQQN